MLINFLVGILFLVDMLFKQLSFGLPGNGIFLFSEKFVGLKLYKNSNLIFNWHVDYLLFYLFIILFILFLLLIKNYRQKNVFLIFSLSLITAGALSNLLDRLCYGYVIDFLSFFDYSIFNLSDVFIVAGVALSIVHEARRSKK